MKIELSRQIPCYSYIIQRRIIHNNNTIEQKGGKLRLFQRKKLFKKKKHFEKRTTMSVGRYFFY